LSLLLLAYTAAGQGVKKVEPEDLVGMWKMIPLPAGANLNEVDNWPLPNQWFGFFDDGRFVSYHNSSDDEYSVEDISSLFKLLRSSGAKYGEDLGYITIEYPEFPGQPEYWMVDQAVEDSTFGLIEMKKGDVLMGLMNGGDGTRPVYFRHLRRLE
jgi:hypothetical protein